MGDTPTPTAVDLIGNTGLTFALLDDRWRWRERLVETFEFHSTGYVRVRSSYQVRVPTGLVADFMHSTRRRPRPCARAGHDAPETAAGGFRPRRARCPGPPAPSAGARGHPVRPFLDTVAEYGRRWEVLAEAVVPVGRPCIIKLHEDRPLGLRMGGHCRQRLWSGDAASYHAEARVLDPAVVFGATTEIRDPRGHVAEHGFWEGRRVTQDAVSLYSSDADRPLLVDVTLRLRAAWWVRLPAIATMTLAAVAILVSRHVHLEQERLGTLALLAIPISLIAALLIVREQTSLAARLQRTSRGVLLGELLVLWLVVIHRLLNG